MSSCNIEMFGFLSRLYPFLFLVGCCVHAGDLLVKELAKLALVASIIDDIRFIIVFTRRY